MLNIEELRKGFNSILDSLSDKDISEWLTFAEERERDERLKKGQKVFIKLNEFNVVKQSNDKQELIDVEKHSNNINFPTAA
ncbi:hypothetical protein [Salegentibacter sp. Hel_I_6]|uniref:hypothetical protein n=1 Tax=Salegentibacter sp. Hel_I_6 TaxID=1250278 RepID=UPI00056A7E43|nr:hypothetical protein [Salegentibacter sp. Hel_I_6]